MNKILKPYSLLFTLTIPHILIMLIFAGIFKRINSLLNPDIINHWKIAAGIFTAMLLLNTGYAVFSYIKKKELNKFFFLSVFLYIPFAYYLTFNMQEFIPWEVPQWIVSDRNVGIYILTFFMPCFVHAGFGLVSIFTPLDKKYNLIRDVLITFAIPGGWYLAAQVMSSLAFLHKYISLPNYFHHIIIVAMVASVVVFLFMLVRIIFIMVNTKNNIWRIIKIPVIAFFPLVGLIINSQFNAFGKFDSIYYYIIAIINAVLLLMPNMENIKLRIAVFFGKSVTLSYSFYFFIVFMPFLPFSVLLILVLGAGFLMLTPLILMVVHSKSLYEDFIFLSSKIKKPVLWLIMVFGILVIPSFIFNTYSNDKKNINNVLNYIYESEYNIHAKNIDIKGLKRTLKNMNDKDFRGFFIGEFEPYLTDFYRWYVLEDMILSSKKIELIEKIFFGKAEKKQRLNNFIEMNSAYVTIEKIILDTKKEKDFYRTWVDLEIKNNSATTSEFVSEITLPEGVYISNYYLNVNGQKKYGILAEEKSAKWIYNQITSEQRDPGILYYKGKNKVGFRISPFLQAETRKTGVEIVHRNPLKVTTDEAIVKVSEEKGENSSTTVLNNKILYISNFEKQRLQKVKRTPYYHFIVDFSGKSVKKTQKYIDSIIKLHEKKMIKTSKILVTAANYDYKTFDLNNLKYNKILEIKNTGGLYLDKIIKNILIENKEYNPGEVPVIVVVTDNIKDAVLAESFEWYKNLIPDLDYFYVLDSQGNFSARSFLNTAITTDAGIAIANVLAYPSAVSTKAYLADDEDSSIIYDKDIEVEKLDLSKNDWESGIVLNTGSLILKNHPSNLNEKSVSLLKQSFKTKIMSPLTSFIVVENKAQEEVLFEKQKKVMNSKKSLDLGEETKMSEPSIWWMILVLGLGLVVRRWILYNHKKYR